GVTTAASALARIDIEVLDDGGISPRRAGDQQRGDQDRGERPARTLSAKHAEESGALLLRRRVALAHGLRFVGAAVRQVVDIGVRLDLADPGLAEPTADAIVGRRLVLPVRDAAALREIADLLVELGDPAARLHIRGRVVPHVVAVGPLLVAGSGAVRAARARV